MQVKLGTKIKLIQKLDYAGKKRERQGVATLPLPHLVIFSSLLYDCWREGLCGGADGSLFDRLIC
jgi:hypothetical protein